MKLNKDIVNKNLSGLCKILKWVQADRLFSKEGCHCLILCFIFRRHFTNLLFFECLLEVASFLGSIAQLQKSDKD